MTRRKVLRFDTTDRCMYSKGRFGWFASVPSGYWTAILWGPFSTIEITKLNSILYNIPTHYKG